VQAPDLWAELNREQEALTRPTEGGDEANTPFLPDELERLAAQMEALKEYVRQNAELDEAQRREIGARLDYLVSAAVRGTPRIDWWNHFVGALISLALTSVVQPHVVQSILTMAAHGVAALFGGGLARADSQLRPLSLEGFR
jgi:hypothetical protein